MPLVTCPTCQGKRFVSQPGGGIGKYDPCPTCKGIGLTPEPAPGLMVPKGTSGEIDSPVPTPAPKPVDWQQIVMTCLVTLSAIAGAYSAYVSDKNHQQIREVRSTQEVNAQKIEGLHKQAQAIKQGVDQWNQ